MKIQILALMTILTFIYTAGFAAENETLWNQAAGYYDNGNYLSAVESYNQLIGRGYINAGIYYNLGNSLYKSGQFGRAIWAYRRALMLDPEFEQAQTNLQFARSLNIDRIESRGSGFITDIWNFLTGIFGLNGYLILFTINWWILGGAAGLLIYKGNFAVWPYYLLIASLIIAIFSFTAAARRISIDRLTSWGVLVEDAADIREGPGEDFERIEVGHEGLEFKILGERENSYLVELSNGLKGWIDKETVLKI